MNISWLWPLVLVALPACHSAENASRAARFATTRHLARPDTAEFRAMRTNDEGVTCGEVRGRDAGGKPEPYRKFIFFAHTGHAIIQPDVGPAANGSDDAYVAQQELSRFEVRFVTDCR